MPVEFHAAPISEMNPLALYRVLRLRTDVFVVEQECAYPELDGRDLESDALMLWGEAGGDVIATLRILRDAAAMRIGRVAVRRSDRGTGIARTLMLRGLELCEETGAGLDQVLDAQEPLERWYGAFGFVRDGATFLEDGIPHVPMRRASAARSA